MMPEVDLDALDFSKDSLIKEELLEKIKYSYFSELEDSDLDGLNAAGEVWIDNHKKTERKE